MELGIIGNGALGTALEKAFSSHKVKSFNGQARYLNPEDVPQTLLLTIPSEAEIEGENAIKFYINRFKQSVIILTSKGLAALELYKSLSTEDKERVFVFSGPNLSDQLGETPSATVLANEDLKKVENLAESLATEMLQILPSNSPLVTQYGGVLKNLLVFHLGKNWSKLENSNKKISAIVEAIMAGFSVVKNKTTENPAKFYGISGVGDILLCTDIFPVKEGGNQSRNFQAGLALANSNSENDVLKKFGTVESYKVVKRMKTESVPELETSELTDFLENLENQDFDKNLNIDCESKIYRYMQKDWQDFLSEAKDKQYLSNTFAWKFCKILENSAKKYFVDLAIEKNARKILTELLQIVLSAK